MGAPEAHSAPETNPSVDTPVEKEAAETAPEPTEQTGGQTNTTAEPQPEA